MIPTKACPVVLRRHHGITQILAFRHPVAGFQLVKGTIEHGEPAAVAAIRELFEESGIRDAQVTADLGLWRAPYQDQVWSFQLCETAAELLDAWVFETRDDGGHVFEFFWHALEAEFPEYCHMLFQEALRELRGRVMPLAGAPKA